MSPPLVHKNSKTANVLVDENFIAKVADAGIQNLLGRVNVGGPSGRTMADNIFLAPEVKEFGRFSDKSDVYSFGVFLLELVSGHEAAESGSSESNRTLVEWSVLPAKAGCHNPTTTMLHYFCKLLNQEAQNHLLRDLASSKEVWNSMRIHCHILL